MGEELARGQAVRKVKGLPFGGVPCKQCGFTEYATINGDLEGGRVTARHPEGWSHIFDPAQLEPVVATRPSRDEQAVGEAER